jgi:5-methylcytosine-specific restriction endonuclease McrA
MKDCLVLNKNFYAIHIATWEKAIALLYTGQAKAVDEDLITYDFDNWTELSKLMKDKDPGNRGFVHSASLRIAIPEVIQLTRYDRLPKQEAKFSRRNIFEHYNFTCCYCGKKFPKPSKDKKPELNLDHVIPRSKGGPTNWNNIVLSCVPCNTKKDDKALEEVHMKLLVKPSRPKWNGNQAIKMQASTPIPVSWQRLIDDKYWNTILDS